MLCNGVFLLVLDLIFLETTDVIFKVVLALFSYHKENLLQLDSFEEIMNYLKNKLPTGDYNKLDAIMKEVSSILVLSCIEV